jgi:protein-S-isoprenylcysteine O-methyltransferase Ste14
MDIFLDYLPLLIYALLFAGLKISERAALTRPGNNIRKGWGDWTVWLILGPMWLVLIGPIAEFVFLHNRPTLWEMLAGGLLFLGAVFFSVKGYRNLEQGFSQAIELDDTQLVITGLYKTIRHPVSLGNILFLVACPLFLAAGPSWIPALVGVLGVLLRISIEESFMQRHISDYAAYKERTWALIPFLY